MDDIIPFDVPWVKTDETNGKQQLLALADELRSRRFDAAVIFTAYSQNPLPAAMLCYYAGIKRSWAIAAKTLIELISQWMPDREPLDYIVHEVQRQLQLVGMAGGLTSDTRLSLGNSGGKPEKVSGQVGRIRIGRMSHGWCSMRG